MISLKHVYKTYPGAVHALKNVDLKVDKGEFIFLRGRSGAGKTTLFNLISAFDKPTSGAVEVLGFSIDKITKKQIPFLRRQIGVVYQDFKLLKNKTIFENVAIPLRVQGEKEKYINKRVREVLDQVGLWYKQDSFPSFLSGGEQQRVAIARAIIHRPSLLIADEPTGNLDPELTLEIMDLFESVNAQGTTVFIATHDLGVINRTKRKVIHLNFGEVKEENV